MNEEIKEIRDRLKARNIKNIKLDNKRFLKSYFISNFLGLFLSSISIASFMLWHSDKIKFYMVEDKYICFFINLTFYKVNFLKIDNEQIEIDKKVYKYKYV